MKAAEELKDRTKANPWAKAPLNKDMFVVALAKHPQPDWYKYAGGPNHRTQNMAHVRWPHHMRRTYPEMFNVLYERFKATGEIDLSEVVV